MSTREVLRGAEPETLTPRERDVLRCMSYGLTVAQTAGALRVSPWTVRWHRTNLLWKLAATNPPHAVAIGYEHGLLG
jgi:DNA-binding CsgD family transcriptional regulator